MTCIVAMVDAQGKGHMACDSLGSNGFTGNEYQNQKIVRKGSMMMGFTGSYRMGQLLEHQLRLPDRKVNQTLDNYMYVDFINAVRQLLKDNGFLEVDRNVESIGSFLIVVEGRLFKMQSDLSMLEPKDKFTACGSGEYHAKGALYMMSKVAGFTTIDLTPRKMLEYAVETASRFVVSVGGEIHYLSEVTS